MPSLEKADLDKHRSAPDLLAAGFPIQLCLLWNRTVSDPRRQAFDKKVIFQPVPGPSPKTGPGFPSRLGRAHLGSGPPQTQTSGLRLPVVTREGPVLRKQLRESSITFSGDSSFLIGSGNNTPRKFRGMNPRFAGPPPSAPRWFCLDTCWQGPKGFALRR